MYTDCYYHKKNGHCTINKGAGRGKKQNESIQSSRAASLGTKLSVLPLAVHSAS